MVIFQKTKLISFKPVEEVVMAEVSLSKALNVKSKLAGRVAHVINLVANNNSSIKGSKKNFDVKVLLDEYNAKSVQLAQVKAAIAKANAANGIFDIIYLMAELKSKISFIRAINTKEGDEEIGYGERVKTITYEVIYDAASIEAMALEAEKEIEELQDKITYLNQTVKVTLPD